MPFIEDFAQQAAQQTLGAGLGIILGGINDRRQLRQQEKLQGMQIRGQKEMTDYQMMKQLEMWDKTNFSAQVAQLHKAGLNPALLYGKSGPGGATAAVSPGSITGAHAPTGGGEAIGMGLSMANMGLLKAQKENIEADTANKKAQTTKTAGVDTTLGQTQIQSLLQGIQSAKAQQKLTEIQSNISQLQLDFDTQTFENRKSIVNIQLSKMVEEVRILENQKEISEATKDEAIKLIEQDLATSYLQQALTKAQTAKSYAEKSKILEEIPLLTQEHNIKQIDEYLSKQNINPKDPFWARSIQDLIQRLFGKKK